MADRIAVMEEGRVCQIATPEDLYEFPSSRFVADFIGKVNLLDGKTSGARGKAVKVGVDGIGELTIPHEGSASGDVALAVRPEKLLLSKRKPTAQRIAVKGKIINIAYYGNASHVFLETDTGVPLTANVQNETRSKEGEIDIGDDTWISWRASDTLILNE